VYARKDLWSRSVAAYAHNVTFIPGSPQAAPLSELDAAIADLFDLDMRFGPVAEDLPAQCSADCTSDGCSRPTRPC
jgi:hypothetical protein